MFIIPKRFRGIKRFEQILRVATKYELGHFLEKAMLKKKKIRLKKKTNRPVELRMMFEELGGTFIKLGQLLSLRPDLIPKEYCDELSKLQDDVEPFAYEEVEYVIRAELKKPVKKLFKSFNKKPIAAASIGQVHVAKLKSGKKVAVKVMRPGIKALIDTDLEILDYMSRVLKHHLKQNIVDPEEIFEEFKHYTRNELDYLKEAHNIKIFYNNFRDDKKVRIPRVYDSLTSRRILTMEFLEGIELRNIIINPKKYRYDKKKISGLIVNSVMKQIFIQGFFHADPHPANILVKKDSIGLIDFGIVGRLDDEMKEKLGLLFINLMHTNADGLVKSLISLSIVDVDVNANALKKDLHDVLGEYYDTSLDKIDMVDLFLKTIRIAKKHNIKMPRDFVLLGKALVTLQGVGIELNPGFNLVRETHPFIDKLVKKREKPSYIFGKMLKEARRFSEFVHELPDESKKIYRTMEKADNSLNNINMDLQDLVRELRVESWRIIMGMIIAALLIAASLIRGTDPGLKYAFTFMASVLFLIIVLSILKDTVKKK